MRGSRSAHWYVGSSRTATETGKSLRTTATVTWESVPLNQLDLTSEYTCLGLLPESLLWKGVWEQEQWAAGEVTQTLAGWLRRSSGRDFVGPELVREILSPLRPRLLQEPFWALSCSSPLPFEACWFNEVKVRNHGMLTQLPSTAKRCSAWWPGRITPVGSHLPQPSGKGIWC